MGQTKEIWAVVEMFGGLPEGVWVCHSEEAAVRVARGIAAETGYSESEGYWVRGDSELHVRQGKLYPEASE